MNQTKTILFLILTFIPVSALAASYQAIVLKITDGDTLWVQMQQKPKKRIKLRLLGIDTPEEYYSKKMSKDTARCGLSYSAMRKLGLAATDHTKTMIFKGQQVTIQTFGKGFYGRILAFVILPDGTNYNEQEIADGYACVYTYHGHKSKELSQTEFDRLNLLMNQAKIKRKGLWGSNFSIMNCLCR